MLHAPLVLFRPAISYTRIAHPKIEAKTGAKKKQLSRRRCIVAILFALTCVPYLIPEHPEQIAQPEEK